jgi:hypothetical protein
MKEYSERLHTELVKAQLRARCTKASVQTLETQAWLVGEENVRGWHACTMRIACETRSVCMKETSADNVKRRILGSNAGRGVQWQPLRRLSI